MRDPLKGAQAVLAGLLALLIIAPGSAAAQSLEPGLRGTVASDQEGRMEGVVVSAKKAGTTITVSVVSDANGEYSFPASRLDQGSHEITNYLLPRGGNIRRVFVDDRNAPVTIWVGSNLGAAVVKIEPLD